MQINDGLPQLICAQCICQVNNAYSFKKLCEENDFTLRKIIFKTENDNDSSDDNDIDKVDNEIEVAFKMEEETTAVDDSSAAVNTKRSTRRTSKKPPIKKENGII